MGLKSDGVLLGCFGDPGDRGCCVTLDETGGVVLGYYYTDEDTSIVDLTDKLGDDGLTVQEAHERASHWAGEAPELVAVSDGPPYARR